MAKRKKLKKKEEPVVAVRALTMTQTIEQERDRVRDKIKTNLKAQMKGLTALVEQTQRQAQQLIDSI